MNQFVAIALLLVLVIMTFVSSTNAQWTTSEILGSADATANTSNMAMFVACVLAVLALIF